MSQQPPAKTLDWGQLVRAAAGREQPYPVYPFRRPRLEKPLRPGQRYPSIPDES